MERTYIPKALDLFAKVGHVFIATSNRRVTPHIAIAKGLSADGELLKITDWFCNKTLENLNANPRLTLVVWDESADQGYQLTGTSTAVTETAALDGYVPEIEEHRALPQFQHQIVMRVEKAAGFRSSPHNDGRPSD